MKKKSSKMTRRDFMKIGVTSAAALGVASRGGKAATNALAEYDAKGLPTRIFGKTGVRIPLIVFGGGSRFCTVKDPEASSLILSHALDNGFYYWDTAHTYVYDGVCSEERYGRILKDRRKEVFLATKLSDRSYEGAMRELEGSLKRLRTDHLDLLQIHNIQSLEDVDRIAGPDSVLKVLHKARDEKITRFLGYSGHTSSQAMTAMARRFEFDTMLIALNHYSQGKEDFEQEAVPAASAKNMGILAMKVIRPRETVQDISAEELIRYALGLEGFHAAVIGTDSLEVLKQNIALVKTYRTLPLADQRRIHLALEPFFAGKDVAWMQPGYRDGC